MIYHIGEKWIAFLTILFFIMMALTFFFPGYIMYSFLGIFLFAWIMMFIHFRNPSIMIQARDQEILSSADGKIIRIDKTVPKEYIKSPCWLVSTYCSWFNSHINRIPTDGIIKFLKYSPGRFERPKNENSSYYNEQMIVGIQKKHYKLIVAQVAGRWTRKIVCRLWKEKKINKGDVFGFIFFPCKIDLYLPLTAKIKVKVGDEVKAGLTVIGELKS